jgi:hypothetical protein
MKKIITAICLLAGLSSCEKVLFEEQQSSQDPKVNFDYLWKECRDKYAFLEYKKVDWQQVYNTYAPRISSSISKDSLFNTMAMMLNELRDGHVNLISPFNISVYPVHLLGPNNIDKRLIEEHYLSRPFFISGPFVHSFIDSGRIGYIQFSSFTGTVTNEQMDYMLEKYQDTQGLILDLRGNGGGAATDIYKIMNRFVESKTKIFRTKDKSGPGPNDFSEGLDSYLEPYAGRRYPKKVAVLCDRGTYSAGSYTSLATKALDHVLLIGDTTGGGLGMPNGGQLPNGWTYRFSVTQTLDLEGNNYEDGVPPDIRVILDPADAANGKDSVLERAMEELKKP